MINAYETARFIKRYIEKNNYAPTIEMVGTPEYVEQLRKNGVVETLSFYAGGPAIDRSLGS